MYIMTEYIVMYYYNQYEETEFPEKWTNFMTGNPISLQFRQHIILRTNEYYIIYHVCDMYSIFITHIVF